jgi:hypothetical protein
VLVVRGREQRAIVWPEVRRGGRATNGKRRSGTQLFGDEGCTAVILDFLATMEVGMRGRAGDGAGWAFGRKVAEWMQGV